MEDLEKIFENLYSTFDGHLISMESRWKLNLDYETDRHFVYWEVWYEGMKEIFSKLNIFSKKNFLDLWAWTGKAIILASIFLKLEKSSWIEYFSSLAQKWNEIIQKAKDQNFFQNEANIFCWDFFDFDWSDYDIIFAHSTCFNTLTIEKIAQKSKQTKKWTIFISTSQKLEAKNLKLINNFFVKMWRWDAEIFIYENI